MINWQKFLSDHNIDYITEGVELSPGWIGVPCPYCHDRRGQYHLGIPPTGYNMTCWKCGKHSNNEVVSLWLNTPIANAIATIAKYANNNEKFYNTKQVITHSTVCNITESQSFTPVELQYLKLRNITEEHIKEYSIRSGGITGFFAHRIVLPIYYNNQLVSATGRAINSSMLPKYLTLSESHEVVHHKHILYNVDKCTGRKGALVEGPLDSVLGGKGFMSTFGTSITKEQLLLLTKLKNLDTIYVVMDMDEAGTKARDKFSFELASMLDINIEMITFSTYKDTGGMPIELINELRKELQL